MADHVVRVLDAAHVRHADLDVELRGRSQLSSVAARKGQRPAADRISVFDTVYEIHRIAGAAQRHIKVAALGKITERLNDAQAEVGVVGIRGRRGDGILQSHGAETGRLHILCHYIFYNSSYYLIPGQNIKMVYLKL